MRFELISLRCCTSTCRDDQTVYRQPLAAPQSAVCTNTSCCCCCCCIAAAVLEISNLTWTHIHAKRLPHPLVRWPVATCRPRASGTISCWRRRTQEAHARWGGCMSTLNVRWPVSGRADPVHDIVNTAVRTPRPRRSRKSSWKLFTGQWWRNYGVKVLGLGWCIYEESRFSANPRLNFTLANKRPFLTSTVERTARNSANNLAYCWSRTKTFSFPYLWLN